MELVSPAKGWPFPPLTRIGAPVPVSAGGRVFPWLYNNTLSQEGMGVIANVNTGSELVWRSEYWIPDILPGRNLKAKGMARANAATGAAKYHIKHKRYADGTNPDTLTLNDEGLNTLTWATGDEGKAKFFEIELDAETLLPGGVLRVDLVLVPTSWTLAVNSCWFLDIF